MHPPRHTLVETFNCVSGILLNAFLLYLIHRFSRKELGAYKHLLIIFAAHDIFLSLVEALLNMKVVRVGTIVSVVSQTFWESRHIVSAYVGFYSLPFFLTNLNFLYRYWAIKSTSKLLHFSSKSFQVICISLVSATCMIWYLIFFLVCDGAVNEPETEVVREAYRLLSNQTIIDGWVVMDFWPDGRFALKNFLVLLFTDILMSTSFLTAVALCTMTFYHIQANTMVSETKRKSQRTVLIALCVQALVPVLCVYIPYVNNMNAPFFGVDDLIAHQTSASLLSAFPLLDAIVIIMMMRDYRMGAISLVLGKYARKPDAISGTFVSSAVNPSVSIVTVA